MRYLLIVLVSIIFVSSCALFGQADGALASDLNGKAQKGPFVVGSSVSVSELDDTSSELSPTGRRFETTILDNTGAFEITGVELVSPFIEVSIDGFFFDEVSGELSPARLQLFSLANVANGPTVNVNILTHLERPRVSYLIGEGQNWEEAKEQALSEVLAIFGMSLGTVPDAEQLDISSGGAANAALLAVSAIVKGTHTIAELTELLANMSTDLRTDGVLDSGSSGSALINEATLLDLTQVRQNITERYAGLGVVADVGNFESHVNTFMTTSSFSFTKFAEYPSAGIYGTNVLDPSATVLTQGAHSFRAELPAGVTLRVVMTLTSGDVASQSWYTSSGAHGAWFAYNQTNIGGNNVAQEFVVTAEDGIADLSMSLYASPQPGTARIDYYENNAETATFSKNISW